MKSEEERGVERERRERERENEKETEMCKVLEVRAYQ
jgi:hypothetical protein